MLVVGWPEGSWWLFFGTGLGAVHIWLHWVIWILCRAVEGVLATFLPLWRCCSALSKSTIGSLSQRIGKLKENLFYLPSYNGYNFPKLSILPHPFIQAIAPTPSHKDVHVIEAGPRDSFSWNFFSIWTCQERHTFCFHHGMWGEGKELIAIMCPASCG